MSNKKIPDNAVLSSCEIDNEQQNDKKYNSLNEFEIKNISIVDSKENQNSANQNSGQQGFFSKSLPDWFFEMGKNIINSDQYENNEIDDKRIENINDSEPGIPKEINQRNLSQDQEESKLNLTYLNANQEKQSLWIVKDDIQNLSISDFIPQEEYFNHSLEVHQISLECKKGNFTFDQSVERLNSSDFQSFIINNQTLSNELKSNEQNFSLVLSPNNNNQQNETKFSLSESQIYEREVGLQNLKSSANLQSLNISKIKFQPAHNPEQAKSLELVSETNKSQDRKQFNVIIEKNQFNQQKVLPSYKNLLIKILAFLFPYLNLFDVFLLHNMVKNIDSLSKEVKQYLNSIIIQGMPWENSLALWNKQLQLSLLQQLHPTRYKELSVQNSQFQHDIQIDIERTLCNDESFMKKNGQQQIKNILRALSHCFQDFGYIQGWNSIAGFLVNVGFEQEDCFWVLLSLFKKTKVIQIFQNNFQKIKQFNFQVKEVLQSRYPDLSNHFQRNHVDLDIFLDKWHLTLFTEDVPHHHLMILWNYFLLNKFDQTDLLNFEIELIAKFKSEILSFQDFDDIYFYMKDFLPTVFANTFSISDIIQSIDENTGNNYIQIKYKQTPQQEIGGLNNQMLKFQSPKEIIINNENTKDFRESSNQKPENNINLSFFEKIFTNVQKILPWNQLESCETNVPKHSNSNSNQTSPSKQEIKTDDKSPHQETTNKSTNPSLIQNFIQLVYVQNSSESSNFQVIKDNKTVPSQNFLYPIKECVKDIEKISEQKQNDADEIQIETELLERNNKEIKLNNANYYQFQKDLDTESIYEEQEQIRISGAGKRVVNEIFSQSKLNNNSYEISSKLSSEFPSEFYETNSKNDSQQDTSNILSTIKKMEERQHFQIMEKHEKSFIDEIKESMQSIINNDETRDYRDEMQKIQFHKRQGEFICLNQVKSPFFVNKSNQACSNREIINQPNTGQFELQPQNYIENLGIESQSLNPGSENLEEKEIDEAESSNQYTTNKIFQTRLFNVKFGTNS